MLGRKQEDEYRKERVTIQVTSKEKEIIFALAKQNGMTVGAYIRKICLYDKWNKAFEDGTKA